MASRIKKGDLVAVIAGKDRGAQGRVLRILTDRDRVVVEGINVIKRHQRPTPQQPQGGIIEREAPIHVSNVMPVDTKTDKPTRIRMGTDKDGKKVRVAVKSGTVID
jgi:large subunit ribosomal protein L24